MDAQARSRLKRFAAFFVSVSVVGALTLTGEAMGYVPSFSPVAKFGVAWTAAFALVMAGVLTVLFRGHTTEK